MPRPINSRLLELFDNRNGNQVVCKMKSCNGRTLHAHPGNMERHLRTIHPDYFYSTYIKLKRDVNNKSKSNVIKPKLQSKEINKANIELAIVEFFTNGWPLQMIEVNAFKILVQPAFDALHTNVNEQNIIERIIAFSQQLKAEICGDLKGKILSLKIDAATIQDLSVLGINVQYIDNNCIQIKTLAVKELKSSHTSKYIKSVILEVLKEYEIDLNQILTITTDNGAKMLKEIKDSNIEFQHCFEEETVDINFTEEWMELIKTNFSTYNISVIQCAAHTLQLCVHDVFKEAEIIEKIEKCRYVMAQLKTQTYLKILKNKGYTNPILDCVTRWNTTFDMLERLLEFKDIIGTLSLENSNLNLSTDVWNFVQAFIKTLKPIYIATKKLQSEQLLFSDLYIILMDILFQVENLPLNEMTPLLIDALNAQKSKLFEIELFNAAVFLDPRIKICLNSEQKDRAKKYIYSLHNRINLLKETISIKSENLPADENMEEPSTSFQLTLPVSFSEYLQNLDPVDESMTESSLPQLESDFMIYDRQSRLPLNSNIIDFWSTQNNTLSLIANIILAIPSTQVSVERLVSALKSILSDQHNSFTDFNLEHILMVKINGTFNYKE